MSCESEHHVELVYGILAPLGRFRAPFWSHENPTGHQQRPKQINTATFLCTLAAKGWKKKVLEGVWNKHEILIKNLCGNWKLRDAKSLIVHSFFNVFVLSAIFERIRNLFLAAKEAKHVDFDSFWVVFGGMRFSNGF